MGSGNPADAAAVDGGRSQTHAELMAAAMATARSSSDSFQHDGSSGGSSARSRRSSAASSSADSFAHGSSGSGSSSRSRRRSSAASSSTDSFEHGSSGGGSSAASASAASATETESGSESEEDSFDRGSGASASGSSPGGRSSAASSSAATVTGRRREQLAGLRVGELRRQARSAGVETSKVDEAIDDADDPKVAIIELILSAAGEAGMESDTERETGASSDRSARSSTQSGSDTEQYYSGSSDQASTGASASGATSGAAAAFGGGSGGGMGPGAAFGMIMRAKNKFKDLGPTVVLDSSSSDDSDDESDRGSDSGASYYSEEVDRSEDSLGFLPHGSRSGSAMTRSSTGSSRSSDAGSSIPEDGGALSGVSSKSGSASAASSKSGSAAASGLTHGSTSRSSSSSEDSFDPGESASVESCGGREKTSEPAAAAAGSTRPATPAAKAAWEVLLAEVETHEEAWTAPNAGAVPRPGRRVNVPGLGRGVVVVSDAPLEDGTVFVHFDSGSSEAAPVDGIRIVKKDYIKAAIASVLEGEVKSRAEEGRDPVPEPEMSTADPRAIALEQDDIGWEAQLRRRRLDRQYPTEAPAEDDAEMISAGARIVAPVAAKKQQKAAEEALEDAERKVRITRYRRMSAVELIRDEDDDDAKQQVTAEQAGVARKLADQVSAELEKEEEEAEAELAAAAEQVRVLAERKAAEEERIVKEAKIQAELLAMQELEDQIRSDAAVAKAAAQRKEENEKASASFREQLRALPTAGPSDEGASATAGASHTDDEVGQLATAAMEAMQVAEDERTDELNKALLDWVRSVPFFRRNAPSEAAQIEICRDLEAVSYVNYEGVCVQGDVGDSYFAILSGEVDVIVDGVTQARLAVPDCFGDRALEGDGRGGDQGVRAATIRAAGQVTLARLKAESYYACMARSEPRQLAIAVMDAMRVAEGERTEDQSRVLLDWVKSVPFFRRNASSEAAQIEICKDLQAVTYASGEDVMVQGDAGDAFFAILLGEVDVVVGREIQAKLSVPKCFGDRALEGDGGVRAATIRAAGIVTLGRLAADSYHACMGRSEARQLAEAAMSAMQVSEHKRTDEHKQALLDWIGSVPFFKKNAPNRAAQVEICKDLERISYENGEDVMVQGDVGDSFFAILLGEVDVVVGGVTLDQLTVPACFGDDAIEGDGGIRTATIRAAGNVILARLAADSYHACMTRSVKAAEAAAIRRELDMFDEPGSSRPNTSTVLVGFEEESSEDSFDQEAADAAAVERAAKLHSALETVKQSASTHSDPTTT